MALGGIVGTLQGGGGFGGAGMLVDGGGVGTLQGDGGVTVEDEDIDVVDGDTLLVSTACEDGFRFDAMPPVNKSPPATNRTVTITM